MKYFLIIILMTCAVNLVFADTHLTLASLSADGQAVQDMECDLQKGGMFALMQVVSDLAKQKNVISACAPSGMAIRLQWNLGGDKGIKALRSSDPDRNSCVIAAFSKTNFSDSGKCSATILVGDATGAKQKADQMR